MEITTIGLDPAKSVFQVHALLWRRIAMARPPTGAPLGRQCYDDDIWSSGAVATTEMPS